jgi:ribosomal silencing factor RsfS
VRSAGGWELLDYGDVVVHILTADQRAYYDLEGFYGAAEEVSLPFDQSDASTSDLDSWAKKL